MYHRWRKIQPKTIAMIQHACSRHSSARHAVAEICEQLEPERLAGLVFFCSSHYDLDLLATEIARHFSCPVIGCTTAGEIHAQQGYVQHSLVAMGFTTPAFRLTPVFLSSLDHFWDEPAFKGLTHTAEAEATSLALLLIDGLTMHEEYVTAMVQAQLPHIPVLGGSAGDDLHFEHTWVYHQGRFFTQAAVIGLLHTTLPFQPLRIQSTRPTPTRLVITAAHPETRRVYEINGHPAATEYARLVGYTVDDLGPRVFSEYPLLLKVGESYSIRSIQRVNTDASLTLYSAIDTGLVLTLGHGGDLLEDTEQALANVAQQLPQLQSILVFDCILRRMLVETSVQEDRWRALFQRYHCLGFNTYGEQYQGMHVNQTLVGVAFGV